MRAGVFGALLAAVCVAPAGAIEVNDWPRLAGLRDKLVAEGVYRPEEFTALLTDAQFDPRVTEALSRPAEKKLVWHQYRPIFVTPERAAEGAQFWRTHAATLRRAQEIYGVPAPVVVAIIGVETRFGAHTGQYRVLDALATIGLSDHPRKDFFFGELEAFLRLVREEALDPRTLTGSYAGAMGLPQFISSSYRAYAVDFDSDGRRDLVGDVEDAIGSVANYLAVHGWVAGTPTVLPARLDDGAAAPPEPPLTLDATLADLGAQGIRVTAEPAPAADTPALLVRLDQPDAVEYRVGLANFYAITRYNRSPLYAMAVHELAEAVEARVGSAP